MLTLYYMSLHARADLEHFGRVTYWNQWEDFGGWGTAAKIFVESDELLKLYFLNIKLKCNFFY